MNFFNQIFSGVYHPKDVPDEKVSSALAHCMGTWRKYRNPESVRNPSKIHGFPTESQRDRTESQTKCHPNKTPTDSVRIPSRFRRSFVRVTLRRDSMGIPWKIHGISMEFPWIPRIPDGFRVSISPCSQCTRAELTSLSRTSFG